MPPDNSSSRLLIPKLVAVATDSYLTPTHPFPDPDNLPTGIVPRYGQDITTGYRRKAPKGQDVGKTLGELKPKMRKLLSIFASGDKTGMAARLFNAFLANSCRRVTYFEDADLNRIASTRPNTLHFCDSALSAPNPAKQPSGKTRIHQALKKVNWDIGKITAPTDLGVPAFNLGSKVRGTEDFANGLGVMINGVQHAYVIATHYHHDKKAQKYRISLKYLFYDVFGLDDDDLNEYGASFDFRFAFAGPVGITAWWQLQFQHEVAPLVTRIVVEKTYEAPAV